MESGNAATIKPWDIMEIETRAAAGKTPQQSHLPIVLDVVLDWQVDGGGSISLLPRQLAGQLGYVCIGLHIGSGYGHSASLPTQEGYSRQGWVLTQDVLAQGQSIHLGTGRTHPGAGPLWGRCSRAS